MIRLFASDLDGTLLNKDHNSDSYILNKAEKLMNKGYVLAAATGRPVQMLHAWQLPGFYFVCCNGALILSDKLDVLYENPIDPGLVRDMYENFEEMPLEFCTLETIYTRIDEETFDENNRKFRKPGSGLIPMKSMPDMKQQRRFHAALDQILAQPVYKVNCLLPETEVKSRFDKWLESKRDQLVNAPSRPNLYEITMKDANKANGVRQLANILGLQDEHAAVFGDGGNDIDMLEVFEASYAPSSASKEAKAAARHIIGPYDEYSVIDEMEKIADSQPPLTTK